MKLAVLFLAIVLAVLASGCSQYAASGQPEAEAPFAGGSSNSVVIKDFTFDPGTLAVKAGTAVNWTNEDYAVHTVKSESFASGNLTKGDRFEFTFANKGSYGYYCVQHPFMKGTIIVE